MDSNIILSYGSKSVSTVISNTFIDNFMADANGGYIKVYVYLLRCHQDPTRTVTIASIADALDETEKYVRIALAHWNDQGVISISKNGRGQITNIIVRDLDEMDELLESQDEEDDIPEAPIVISTETSKSKTVPVQRKSQSELSDEKVQSSSKNPAAAAAEVKLQSETDAENENIPRPNYAAATMATFKNNYPDFAGLMKYLESNIYKRPLSVAEMQPVCFIYDQLEFPSDLIGYLYDYCFNIMGKTGRKYIETVAMNWHGAGITNIDAAKTEIESFSSSAQTVKSALGLGEKLKPAEVSVITRWSREYSMSDDLIREACNKAVLQTPKPSLNYIDKIITDWHNKNVKSIEDVKQLDAAHVKTRAASQKPAADSSSTIRQPKGAYFQYPQRTYTDQELSEIEQRKLKQSKLYT